MHIPIGWQKSHETFHQPGHISNWQIGTTWQDSSVSIHSYWIIKGHMSGHECPVWEHWFLLAVKNQMEVFCGNTYSNHFHINIRWLMTTSDDLMSTSDDLCQCQMTHDIMLMSYSYVMLYHIFISEQFYLHLLGLWLGGFNGFRISLWYEFL